MLPDIENNVCFPVPILLPPPPPPKLWDYTDGDIDDNVGVSGDGEVVGGQRAVSTNRWLCCFLQTKCIDQSLALLCSATKMCH